MFSLKVIDTDSFLDMSPTAQLLYFHLAMRADDDGFVSSPKKIMKLANAADDDMRVLIAKKYLIPFESGVCVIKDWKIHNYIQSDRYQETEYRDEKNLLTEHNGKYEMDTERIQNVSKVLPQVRLELGKVRLGKNTTTRKTKFSQPSLADVVSYCNERKNDVDAKAFLDFYESKGWYVGKNKMKDWRAAVRTWEHRNSKKVGGVILV
jgi:hypothetical protein